MDRYSEFAELLRYRDLFLASISSNDSKQARIYMNMMDEKYRNITGREFKALFTEEEWKKIQNVTNVNYEENSLSKEMADIEK